MGSLLANICACTFVAISSEYRSRFGFLVSLGDSLSGDRKIVGLKEALFFQGVNEIFVPQPPLRIFSDLLRVLEPGQKLPEFSRQA